MAPAPGGTWRGGGGGGGASSSPPQPAKQAPHLLLLHLQHDFLAVGAPGCVVAVELHARLLRLAKGAARRVGVGGALRRWVRRRTVQVCLCKRAVCKTLNSELQPISLLVGHHGCCSERCVQPAGPPFSPQATHRLERWRHRIQLGLLGSHHRLQLLPRGGRVAKADGLRRGRLDCSHIAAALRARAGGSRTRWGGAAPAAGRTVKGCAHWQACCAPSPLTQRASPPGPAPASARRACRRRGWPTARRQSGGAGWRVRWRAC